MPEAYLKGMEEITRIDPECGAHFVEDLKKVSPDFAEYFVGFAFGKIQARTILEPKIKALVGIASLIATGDAESHLRLRILGALRIGCTQGEIIEVIIQSIVNVGFTRATGALYLVREVCDLYAEELVETASADTSTLPEKKKAKNTGKSKSKNKPGAQA